MAANWMNSRGMAKRLLFFGRHRSSPASSRRGLLHSAYEKNVEGADRDHHHDDQALFRQPPQQVKSAEEDNNKFYYWEPHPQTGVFGPAAASGGAAASSGRASTIDDQQQQVNVTVTVTGGAVLQLEENAWFRPTSLEDLEKPHLP